MRLTVGLLRSLVIYYCQPWRRIALKRFYGDLLEKNDLAFDIGAHVASRTRTLLSLGCRVVALEPQPVFADFIAKTLRNPNATLVREAVGAQVGEIELHISNKHPTVSTISNTWIGTVKKTDGFSHVRWDETVTVSMTTLDALIEKHGLPKFCKIDVEGAEADILEGLSQPIALIAFEYIPAAVDIAERCIERLHQLGPYRFNRTVGEKQRFLHDPWLDADEMANILRNLGDEAGSGDVYARLGS